MAKPKYITHFFSITPRDINAQARLGIFSALKSGDTSSVTGIVEKTGLDSEVVAEHISFCVKKDLLKTSGSSSGDPVKFNDEAMKLLGIGFSDSECFLTEMDLAGNTIQKESIDLFSMHHIKGKNKEIKSVVAEIKEKSQLTGNTYRYVGVALPSELLDLNPKSADILATGIGEIFTTDVFIVGEATAAAYGEKTFNSDNGFNELLYLHSDIGTGVIVKDEMVFEAKESTSGNNEEYLRPWSQFDIVSTAVHLVNKGVGTDIVKMVDGDVEAITLQIVLEAADKNDELAEDLIKRSALALGVRLAYLVNMFGVNSAVLGGGTEIQTGNFMKHVIDSANRFLLNSAAKELKLISGCLGKQASSIGVASLLRREIFTEVMEV